MEVIEKHLFECPMCHKDYESKEEAEKCMNSTDKTDLKVGDIVTAGAGFGWFDGDKDWVVNPDVDISKHGFGWDCSMGFYYVITDIATEGHILKFSLFTKAMMSAYSNGYVSSKYGIPLKKVDATEKIKRESKELIGKVSNRLMH